MMDGNVESLMPGQMVNMDGEFYMVIQVEDGSLHLQQLDYQHGGNHLNSTFLDNFSNFEPALTATDYSSFQNDSNALEENNQVISDQNQLPETYDQEQNGACQEVCQTLSSEEQMEVSIYIQNLQSQGYLLTPDIINLLMSGELKMSDIGLGQCDSAAENNAVEGVSNVQDNLAPANQNAINEQFSGATDQLVGIETEAEQNPIETSLDEDRRLKVMAYIQEAQNQGYLVSQEAIDLLMSGASDISDCVFSDRQHFLQSFETGLLSANWKKDVQDVQNLQTGQNSSLSGMAVTANTSECQTSKGGKIVDASHSDDDEFTFAKQMTETEEEARLCTTPGSAPTNHYTKLNQPFIDFLNGVPQETLATSCKPVNDESSRDLPDGKHSATIDNNNNNSRRSVSGAQNGEGSFSTGLARSAPQDVPAKRIKGEESGKERCWNFDAQTENDLDLKYFPSGSLPAPKRKVGRPKGSYRKRALEWNEEEQLQLNGQFDSIDRKRNGDQTSSEGGDKKLLQPQRRGRGRPRKNPLPSDGQLQPVGPGRVLFTSPDDFDCYKVGDFVIERKNMFTEGEHPIYSIFGAALLNYKPEMVNDRLLYRSENKYSRGNFDLRIKYKAVKKKVENSGWVEVELPHESRKVVKFDDDPFMKLLKIYVEILLHYTLDETVLCEILTGGNDELLQVLEEVDKIIAGCLDGIQSMTGWKTNFKESLDGFPYYKICVLNGTRPEVHTQCQERDDPSMTANRVITLFGPPYDRNTLRIIGKNDGATWNAPEKEIDRAVDYFISDASLDLIRQYHALRHFKLTLFREAFYETSERLMRQNDNGKMQADEIIQDAKTNDLWIHDQYMRIKDIMEKLEISVKLSDDPNASTF